MGFHVPIYFCHLTFSATISSLFSLYKFKFYSSLLPLNQQVDSFSGVIKWWLAHISHSPYWVSAPMKAGTLSCCSSCPQGDALRSLALWRSPLGKGLVFFRNPLVFLSCWARWAMNLEMGCPRPWITGILCCRSSLLGSPITQINNSKTSLPFLEA